MDRNRVISLQTAEDTVEFGKAFASFLKSGDIVALSGDLGSGKTTFVQGLAVGLGICDPIQSPTFVYFNHYQGNLSLFHFDLYRVKNEEDFFGMGFDECFHAGGVCVLEWPEKIKSALPDCRWHLSFSYHSNGRKVEIQHLEGTVEINR